ncbi:hypothetical protein HK104_002983 [Borealophlyctis nickersoniae]|nr:hypothetical protein HK104_002983 [Borealophlyctis nickersoniae]
MPGLNTLPEDTRVSTFPASRPRPVGKVDDLDCHGKRYYIAIAWDDAMKSYDAEPETNDDHEPPSATASTTSLFSHKTYLARAHAETDEKLAEAWLSDHKGHEIFPIGQTTMSKEEVEMLVSGWEEIGQIDTDATFGAAAGGFWSDSRNFVDTMTELIVENNRAWTEGVWLPDGMPKTFDAAIPYVDFLRAGHWNPDGTPHLPPRRTPESSSTYCAQINAAGDLEIAFESAYPLTPSASSGDDDSEQDSPSTITPLWQDQCSALFGAGDAKDWELSQCVPSLNIVIMIVGSRGDVQPFVALAKELNKCGHRVRLATHEVFRSFVRGAGVEFFPVAGDPAELMAYMVKNTGLLPGLQSIRQGDIGKNRSMIADIIASTWRACVDPDDETGAPFLAQCIISNPPAFGHIHCAQKLSIPLHIYFTMPWSATKAFPHPLTTVDYGKAISRRARQKINLFTYTINESLQWTGLGDLINKFRSETLGLPTLSSTVATSMMADYKVPHCYCWSPNLIPKPADWGSHIDIAGFFFLDLASDYTPPADLTAFLEAGEPPVYIGFGSIVVNDPDGMTDIVFGAIKGAGVRAIVSKGWGGIGAHGTVPDNVYLIGNCPHDWLFPRCSAVVHHGGAGTTAAALLAGKPTVIVPFFGDQPFWGAMVAAMKVGPVPVPHKRLTAKRLAKRISFALAPEIRTNAAELGIKMRAERGVAAGVRSFHQHLELERIRCDVDPSQVAAVWVRGAEVKCSRRVADVISIVGLVDKEDCEVYRTKVWPGVPEQTDPKPHKSVKEYVSESVQGTGDLIYRFHHNTAHTLEKAGVNAISLVKGIVDIVKADLSGNYVKGAVTHHEVESSGDVMNGDANGSVEDYHFKLQRAAATTGTETEDGKGGGRDAR